MSTIQEIAINHGLYHSFTKEADDKAISAMKEYALQMCAEAMEILEDPVDRKIYLSAIEQLRNAEYGTEIECKFKNREPITLVR